MQIFIYDNTSIVSLSQSISAFEQSSNPPRYFFLEKPSVIFSKSLKNLFLVTAAILDRQDHYNPIRVDLDK
jgi:hypothetical protein